jgi:hypothetical protein
VTMVFTNESSLSLWSSFSFNIVLYIPDIIWCDLNIVAKSYFTYKISLPLSMKALSLCHNLIHVLLIF